MLPPSEASYLFFREFVPNEGDLLKLGEQIPHPVVLKAVLSIKKQDVAERFFAGFIQWFMTRHACSQEEAVEAAAENIAACFDDMQLKEVVMWEALWVLPPVVPDPPPSTREWWED